MCRVGTIFGHWKYVIKHDMYVPKYTADHTHRETLFVTARAWFSDAPWNLSVVIEEEIDEFLRNRTAEKPDAHGFEDSRRCSVETRT